MSCAFNDFLSSLRSWAVLLRFAAANPNTVAELAKQAPGNMSILINALPRRV
jgi:hypothetical protein